MTVTVLEGDVRAMLRTLPAESVHCVWTSVPYWGLRAYGTEPQVWGDSIECTHEWGPEQRNGKRQDIKPQSETASTGRIGSGNHQGTEILTGGHFCQHCGAWRGEHGLEPTLDMWLANEVTIWREVRRVLRKDGTAWLNCGDAYATSTNGRSAAKTKEIGNDDRTFRDKPISTAAKRVTAGKERADVDVGGWGASDDSLRWRGVQGLASKQRLMLPARLALALQADGWWLRDEVILHKTNPMPSSVTDRTTPAHEMLYLLTRAPRYFYDSVAIMEAADMSDDSRKRVAYGAYSAGNQKHLDKKDGEGKPDFISSDSERYWPSRRNKRSVWSGANAPFPDAHFATANPDWVEPCLLAGTSARGCCAKCGAPWRRIVERSATEVREGPSRAGTLATSKDGRTAVNGTMTAPPSVSTLGWEPGCRCDAGVVPCTVLDCFGGSGTTAVVADRLGLDCILIELKPEYATMARRRVAESLPGLPGLS